MHLLPWFAALCSVLAFAAAYGAQTGEFYEYEDQISMESRQAAVETVAMPEDTANPSSNDQDKIDAIKQKMHMRRNGLAARNKRPEASVTSDDLAEVLNPPSNFRAPLPRMSSSQSRSSTRSSTTTTTTTTAVPPIDTDNQPKVRRTRPKSNRLRSTTTTPVPTTTTEEVTTAVATEGLTEATVAEPQPSATLDDKNSVAPYAGPVDLAPLFRDSVRKFEDEPEHSRETLNFRKQPSARESPVFTSGHAEAFEAPLNESIDGVPVYRTHDEPSQQPLTTAAAEPTEEEVTVTEATDTDSTTDVDEVKAEETPEEEEDGEDMEAERRSDESEGSSHFQRRLLDMMVSETRHMLTAVMPDHAALATFKYFPLFEPTIQSRSFNERPTYGYTPQHRPNRPRLRPLLKLSPLNPLLNPHIITRPHKVNRRPPPPPPHSHGKPQTNHDHAHEDVPEKPANFEPYEPFSVNFYPPYEPDFQKENAPRPSSYKPVEYPKETKYEKPAYSPPKPPTHYPKEPEYPKAPEYDKPYPKPPQEYPKVPEYEKPYPKPPQEYPKPPQEYPKAPTYEAYPPAQYEKPLTPQYPKEAEYKPASPPAQYEKPYEKPSTPQYPKEPTYPPAPKYEKPYEKPAPQYPKEPTHEPAYPPAAQYEKPSEKPSAPKYPTEPTYEPAYPSAPKYEKPYEKPAPQYPKEPTHVPAYPPAPQYESSPAPPAQYEKPYEKPKSPQYPKEPTYESAYAPAPQYPKEPVYPPAPQYESSPAPPAQYEKPYEKPKTPQYPKEPAYAPAPKYEKLAPQYPEEPAYESGYPQAPKYEKPYENASPQYPKEPTYEPVSAPAPQYEKPYPKPVVPQYPKVPTYEPSSPAPYYPKEPTYTSHAPYSTTTTTKYPQYSYSSPAPAQYPQDSYYSSSQPSISSPVPYVKPIVAYKKPTPPPIYYVSSSAAPAPYPGAYKEPVSQYPASSTPAPAYSTTTVPTSYQEYPPQPQSDWEPKNPQYKPPQQHPQEQYYPQQPYKKPAQQKVSASRTPQGNGTLSGPPTLQNQRDQSNTPLALDETPFEQLDRTQENQGQESEHYSVSTAPPTTYTTKKRHPYQRTKSRTTTAKPSPSFPHQIPSMGFEGQNWDMEDITADKFPAFKISSFFQDAPWPHQDSFISPNGGSQRRPTKAKGTKKEGNTQKVPEAVNIETSGRSALKADEILGLLPEVPANEPSNQNEENQAEGTEPLTHDDSELSPAVNTDVKDSQDINKNVPGIDEDPWREAEVIPVATFATRRKETRTRPRVQKRRITNKQTQTE